LAGRHRVSHGAARWGDGEGLDGRGHSQADGCGVRRAARAAGGAGDDNVLGARGQGHVGQCGDGQGDGGRAAEDDAGGIEAASRARGQTSATAGIEGDAGGTADRRKR